MSELEKFDTKTLIILFLIIVFLVIVAPWVLAVLFLLLIVYVVFMRSRGEGKLPFMKATKTKGLNM